MDNNVTEIITKDKSLVPILFFGRIENIAIAADAPQIATDPALKRPKSLFLRRRSEKKYAQSQEIFVKEKAASGRINKEYKAGFKVPKLSLIHI